MVEVIFTEREYEVVRQALRLQEDNHKRNGFKVLVIECQDLRSRMSNIQIDKVMGKV